MANQCRRENDVVYKRTLMARRAERSPTAMDQAWRLCCIHRHHYHHHHHHHQLFLCPHNLLHHHHHCHCHRQIRPNFAPFPPNQETAPYPAVFPQYLNVGASGLKQSSDSAAPQVLQEQEQENYIYGIEEEDDEEEEPIFVLTDEWRDFFAKSEAKRKLEKKRAKKGKK